MSFDVNLTSTGFSDVANLKYKKDSSWSGNYGDGTSADGARETSVLEASKLPFKSSGERDDIISGFWVGNEKETKFITKYEISGRKSNDQGGGSYNFSYQYNDENTIQLRVVWNK